MSPTTLLFLLRLASAAILLSFLGLIFWYLRRDLQEARAGASGAALGHGALRVLANTAPQPAVNTVLPLAPITTIGRNGRNTIVLDDAFVSGDHALLAWRDSQWWLEDINSRNGTLLNDVPLTDPVVISAGDVIAVGGIRLKLELPGMQNGGGEESGIRDSNP